MSNPRVTGQAPQPLARQHFSRRFRARFAGLEPHLLDLSLLTSDYERHIHPCPRTSGRTP
ncbi:MAG: hypothetical protein LCH79_17820 [Proteobacteria bacterium]|jgi:hypothetical protein|nr:hypothetical protein [Ramlibacter sp.]MCA0215018.1 hypothetical protein [Pseudomonadota bacterium]